MIKINVYNKEKMAWIEQQNIQQCDIEVVEWVINYATFERIPRIITLTRERDQMLYYLKFGN